MPARDADPETTAFIVNWHHGAGARGALGGNKVYLVSQYEYTPVARDIDGNAYVGQQWFDEKVRVGVTGLANQKAYGADINLRYSDTTFIEGEISRSDGPGLARHGRPTGG